ncbi:SDR family oxidoreductase [uncultured Acinetobacter sp.]|uniref:SDR family oxidoreductase n=1 Tax=uncultured Acinetobacter sp. TaxID=165433 RepID=UPI0025E4E2A0|nr:SDR family oxidoreductase [uncultured Acinetobacter sp.]
MENKQTKSHQQQVALVAGATGFVGRFLIAELLKRGHHVFALLRNPIQQQAILEQWLSLKQVSIQRLSFIQGDVTQPKLGISEQDWEKLSSVNTLYNSSALFAWNLSMQQARAVNVDGALNLLRCVAQHCDLQRAVHVSGYMLTILSHLQQAGVCLEQPDRTNWSSVYQQLGAYEASKIEAHYAWIECAKKLSIDWTIIHPATVCGDAVSGEIPNNQPIAQMIDLLKRRKMSAIPATPQHYLPLVSVDDLCQVMAQAATDINLSNQALLVASEQKIPLSQLTQMIAQQLNVSAPKQHVPLVILRLILKWTWLANQLEMSAEMLSFLRTEQLDLEPLKQFRQRWDIQTGNLADAITKTTDWMKQTTSTQIV